MSRRPPVAEFPLRQVLDAVGERPALNADRALKKNYAERLSRSLAVFIARGLRPLFPGVRPTDDDIGHETAFGGEGGKKRVDVAVWHTRDGLLLDVSVKTYSFQDWDEKKQRSGRFTKNLVRNDHELRAEADKIHRRQPYAVLVGVMFMPVDACDDAKTGTSSFAHAVLTFRDRSGRKAPDDPRYDRFEAFFIGLYEYAGERRGEVRFFDVGKAPPKQGRPKREDTLSFSELIGQMKRLHDERNKPEPLWADPSGDDN
jgi:hypothetical protein